MKILKCIICGGEVDIISNDKSVNKKTKCRKCGFANFNEVEVKKQPEVVIIRRKNENY